jgi:hypothetical protein
MRYMSEKEFFNKHGLKAETSELEKLKLRKSFQFY